MPSIVAGGFANEGGWRNICNHFWSVITTNTRIDHRVIPLWSRCLLLSIYHLIYIYIYFLFIFNIYYWFSLMWYPTLLALAARNVLKLVSLAAPAPQRLQRSRRRRKQKNVMCRPETNWALIGSRSTDFAVKYYFHWLKSVKCKTEDQGGSIFTEKQ
jgi:hypothetical protein